MSINQYCFTDSSLDRSHCTNRK